MMIENTIMCSFTLCATSKIERWFEILKCKCRFRSASAPPYASLKVFRVKEIGKSKEKLRIN